MKNLLGIALALAFAGCTTTKIHEYTAHEDANAKPADVSVLFVPRHIFVHEIDGEGRYHPSYISAVAPYHGAKIELLPGKHVATVAYNSTTSATKRSPLAFDLSADQKLLHCSRHPYQGF